LRPASFSDADAWRCLRPGLIGLALAGSFCGMQDDPTALEAFARPAAVAQVGGFRPPDDPLGSWVGTVVVARPDEAWPTTEGEPMLALAQIRLDELPFRPPALDDTALLTLFIGPHKLPIDEPNGSKWCLRAYETTDGLQRLEAPAPARAGDPKLRKGQPTTYRPFPVRWQTVTDWPSRDEVPLAELARWEELVGADDTYVPHLGFKVGGWPYCVQHEVEWREQGAKLTDVDFVVQVDSDPKVGFAVGYGGVCYIGRRRTEGTWHLTWQSM
jgi:hypothetical protein